MDYCISLMGYRPPQAGQPPVSKVPIRHGLPASMELTASAQQADRQTTIRQTKERKEDASSSHSKLECQDHASRLIE